MPQVYKNVKPKLSKEARLAFLDLDALVRGVTTAKDMRDVEMF